MTRDEAKQLLPIIQAWTEGKEIEYYSHRDLWEIPNGVLNFNLNPCLYRVKPEPTYRPFKNMEECWQEMQKHQPFGWVKGSHGQFFVAGIRDTDVAFGSNSNWESYHYIFNEYTFADGQPFGILEE